jgi:hypothetical protein
MFTIPFKILTWGVLTAFLCQIIALITIARCGNNIIVSQIESLTDFIFFSVSFYFLFKNRLIKRAIVISIITITVFFFINAMFFQAIHKVFPTNIYFPTQILFAVFSLLLFKEMLMYPLKINIIKQSVFWYNTAILFYATTMFFNFGLSNYLVKRNLNDYFIYYFWYFILHVFYILIGISLLTDKKKFIIPYAR